MNEFGIFSDESADFTADEALEADFATEAEAQHALINEYSDCNAFVHLVERADA